MPLATENPGSATRADASLWFQAALLPEGWTENVRLQITAGLISSVETDAAPLGQDDRGSVAIPGLSNLHSHAFQRGMAGLAEVRGPGADTFWTWREVMYHFLDRLTPEDMEAIAAQAFVEMVESGFTRVGEFHYVHHDRAGIPYTNTGELAGRICAAAATAGINLTLLPVFYAHANFGGSDPTPGQRRFVCTLGQFAGLLDQAEAAVKSLPGANVGVAPHSLRAVTAPELREIVAWAGNRPIHIHAAEQVQEVADCLAATGQRPVEWLLTHAEVGPRWAIIHATHLTPAEITGLAASGATAGLCPITEANLGDGIFPAAEFLAQGGMWGVGTDSNIHIQAAGELRALEYSQRLANRGRNILARAAGASTGRCLFEQALAGGHRALAAGPGGLAAGRAADIVTLGTDYAALTSRERGDTILDRFIFAGPAGAAIDRVWVRGKCVVAGGRHLHRDSVTTRFRAALCRLLQGSGGEV
jgi:formimidoylglutamate deiminase